MEKTLSPNGLGIAMALVDALFVLILSLVGLAGFATTTVDTLKSYGIGYDLTFLGIVVGILVAAIFGYIFGWLTAALYNKFA